MRRFLVIGLGRFGSALAEALAQAGGEIIAVDERMELVEAVKDKVAYAAQLEADLAEREVAESQFQGAPRLRGARFTRPELVCEVEYLKWTDDGKLRAASFKGLRPDKLPTDCRREDPVAAPG